MSSLLFSQAIDKQDDYNASSVRKPRTNSGSLKPVIGAVHFLPIAGYGTYAEEEIIVAALQDLTALEAGGVDAVIYENNYDVPHRIFVSPETVAMMTRLISRLGIRTRLPFGVSVLWNDYRAALTIAKSTGGSFIRVPVFVDHVATNYGDINGKPADVVAYRTYLQAEHVKLFTDIHVKHSKLKNR